MLEALESRALFDAVPVLNSDPAAGAQIYLDFIGAPAQQWGGYSVPATPSYVGTAAQMSEIWARVAEKYSPFNVNVTTVAPKALIHKQISNPGNMMIVVGGDGSWYGSAGGVSYYASFWLAFNPNVSWVFSQNLANDPKFVAEASAHEAGHEFGLEHQSEWNGSTFVSEYYHGDGLTAPIMGNSYGSQRGLWWNGTNHDGNVQDDLSVIAGNLNGFGYRAKDHGQNIATADAINGTAAGVIEQTTDTDFFKFSANGQTTVAVGVAQFGPMLHARLQIFDASGNLVATDADPNTLGQTFVGNFNGTYYAAVESYGQYGDVGQYTITVSGVPEPMTGSLFLAGCTLLLRRKNETRNHRNSRRNDARAAD